MSQDSTKNRIRLGSDDRDVKRGLIARNFFRAEKPLSAIENNSYCLLPLNVT